MFEVASKSNKRKLEVQSKNFFSKRKAVNIINKGKVKRFRVFSKRNDVKKAVITLEEGNTIDISAEFNLWL